MMETIDFPETSAANCQYTLLNYPIERRSEFLDLEVQTASPFRTVSANGLQITEELKEFNCEA
jgi:hypothetical protein